MNKLYHCVCIPVNNKIDKVGTNVDISFNRTYSSVSGKNSITVTLKYKKHASSSWTTYGSVSSGQTLTDNPNRALTTVRTEVVRKGGHLGSVMFNFTTIGALSFKGTNRDEVEEALILGDVDVQSVEAEEDMIYVTVSPAAFALAKEVLAGMGITEFEEAEVRLEPNEWIDLDEESKGKFEELIDALEECEDVQSVAHNVNL